MKNAILLSFIIIALIIKASSSNVLICAETSASHTENQNGENQDSTEDDDDEQASQLNPDREFRIDLPGRNRVVLYGKTALYYLKKKVSELKDNAYVKSKSFEVYADRILYFEKYLQRNQDDGESAEHAQAWGNVIIIDKKEKVNITGAAAFYYPDRKYMRITGGARMVNNKDGVVISGETIERFSKTNILIVTGYVVVLKPKEGVKILAGRMKYNTKTKEMTLVGNVKIWENKKENLRYISGDRVFVTRDDKKRSEHMVVTGNAYMEEKKKKKLIRKVNAGKIDYYSVKDKKDKKVVEKIILSDHAYIVTEKQKIRALKITVDKDLKEKKEVWELFERVFVKDLKSEDEMRGGYMIYNKTDEVIRVTKNPSFYVFKEKAYIYSDVITSYRNKKLSVFVGDVEILQEDQKIYGENAVFNERLKRIVITGEPLIINKDNITYADKVTFLTDKKEVRLSSRFRGVLLPDEVSGRRRQGQNGRREHKRVEIGDIGGPEVL